MRTLRSIVFTSVLAGLFVGVMVTLAHQFATVPLVLASEAFEQQAGAAEATAAPHDHAAVGHDHGAAGRDPAAGAHDHGAQAEWAPADGLERTVFTALGDIVTAIGFALVLTSAYVLIGRPVSWREGVLWGLAGFAVFTLAPSLGLPPELPGMPAAELAPRQAWWIATVAATGAGLALLVLRRSVIAALVGVALIVAPHLVGAPTAPAVETAVPHQLWWQFVVAVTVTSFVFWVALGGVTGALIGRFSRA
jgi:cobalt transporter subunit CbtA